MKQIGSAIIGAQSPAQQVENSIGRPLGETGVGKKAIEKLSVSKPSETDSAVLEALSKQQGLCLEPRYEFRYPEGAPAYAVCVGFTATSQPLEFDYPAMIQTLDLSMLPAPREPLVHELTALRLSTVPRNADVDDIRGQFLAYIRALQEYPADVALHTLRRWTHRTNGKWFPTVAELHAACKPQATMRAKLREVLRKRAEREAGGVREAAE